MIKYRWRWICDVCGREAENSTEYRYSPGWAALLPSGTPDFEALTEGPWSYVGERLVCDNHKVTIEDV